MHTTVSIPTSAYDQKLLHIITDTVRGDEANLRLPVKAARKLLDSIGKIPVGGTALHGTEWEALMEDITTCLDEERSGSIVAAMLPDGTRIRAFVY